MASSITHLLISSILLLLLVKKSLSQVTATPVCESTGHRCINLDQCAGKPNAQQYQWCGGCQYNVRCDNGIGSLWPFYNPSYTQWDDNRKNYELTSTTCVECYTPCPPGPSAPQQPVCDRTGLGCLSTTCIGGPAGNFQYCGNCSYYANCALGNTGPITLVACASGQVYDDISRTCQATSETCRECYDTCYPPTSPEPTTVEPTTEPADTTEPQDLETTEGPDGGAGGTTAAGPGQPDNGSWRTEPVNFLLTTLLLFSELCIALTCFR